MTKHIRTSRHWLPFATGIALGLAAGLLGVGLALAAERARQQAAARRYGRGPQPARAHQHGSQPARTPVIYPPIGEAELDEELAQSFPASDPLPHPHQVD